MASTASRSWPRGKRIGEVAIDAHHPLHDRLREPLAPGLFGEALEHELGVLPVDHAGVADRARQELGGVAAAREELRDAHAGAMPKNSSNCAG